MQLKIPRYHFKNMLSKRKFYGSDGCLDTITPHFKTAKYGKIMAYSTEMIQKKHSVGIVQDLSNSSANVNCTKLVMYYKSETTAVGLLWVFVEKKFASRHQWIIK